MSMEMHLEMCKMTREQYWQLGRDGQAMRASILQKAANGVPLTDLENHALKGVGVVRFVKTRFRLTRALGVNKGVLALWMRKYGDECPKPATDGMYDTVAWEGFMERKGLGRYR